MSILTAQDREKLTYQYTVALDEGDMDTVARVLSRAEHDPELERLILEINQALIMDDLQTQPLSKSEENTMPVFRPQKRKRETQLRWTAVAAIVASILFVRFAVFMVTDTTVDQYNAENLIAPVTIDKAELTRQFLNAWNDNNPTMLDGLLTDAYHHSELGTDEMSAAVVTERISTLNTRFKEVHFFLSDINTSNTRLFATLTLKGLHRDLMGHELNYMTTGFINVAFEADKISETSFTLNVDDFIRRYGQFEAEEMPQRDELYVLPPDDFDDTPQTQTIDINDEAIRGMSLNIDAGNVDLRIGSLPDTVFMGDISNIGAYEYSELGNRIKIINIDNHPYYLLDETGEVPVWFFKIGEGVRTDLDITVGNHDASLDLGQVSLQGMTLTMGASTTSLSLPYTGTNYHVTVTMVSSLARLQLDYPHNVGLRIDAYDGVWQSQSYNHAPTVINLQLNGSLSALDMLDD